MNTTETNLLAGRNGTERKKPAPKCWRNNAGRKDSVVRDVDMIMATPSPRATVTNAPNVITKPRSRGTLFHFHQLLPDQAVLDNLFGCIGKAVFSLCGFLKNRHILDHRQPDAAQDTHCHGASR